MFWHQTILYLEGPMLRVCVCIYVCMCTSMYIHLQTLLNYSIMLFTHICSMSLCLFSFVLVVLLYLVVYLFGEFTDRIFTVHWGIFFFKWRRSWRCHPVGGWTSKIRLVYPLIIKCGKGESSMNRDFCGEMVWWIFQPATFNKTPGHASGTQQLWHSRHQKYLIAGFELGDFHWKMIVQSTNGGFSSTFYSQRVAHTLYIYRVYIYTTTTQCLADKSIYFPLNKPVIHEFPRRFEVRSQKQLRWNPTTMTRSLGTRTLVHMPSLKQTRWEVGPDFSRFFENGLGPKIGWSRESREYNEGNIMWLKQ